MTLCFLAPTPHPYLISRTTLSTLIHLETILIIQINWYSSCAGLHNVMTVVGRDYDDDHGDAMDRRPRCVISYVRMVGWAVGDFHTIDLWEDR